MERSALLATIVFFSTFTRAETCTLQVMSGLRVTEEEVQYAEQIYLKEMELPDWETCYERALDEAEENDEFIEVQYDIGGIDADAIDSTYVKWTFDDGYIYDSQGEVSQRSPRDPRIGQIKLLRRPSVDDEDSEYDDGYEI